MFYKVRRSLTPLLPKGPNLFLMLKHFLSTSLEVARGSGTFLLYKRLNFLSPQDLARGLFMPWNLNLNYLCNLERCIQTPPRQKSTDPKPVCYRQGFPLTTWTLTEKPPNWDFCLTEPSILPNSAQSRSNLKNWVFILKKNLSKPLKLGLSLRKVLNWLPTGLI